MGQARAAAAGSVASVAGAPLAAAEIRCVGAAPQTFEAFAPPDVVTGQSDAHGRFVVELLTDRVYSVSALGPADANGARQVSDIREGVAAGSVQRLQCVSKEVPAQLQVLGLEAWGDAAPQRVRLRLDAVAASWREVALGADGTAVLPPLPSAAVRLVLPDRDGEPLAAFTTRPVGGSCAVQLAPPVLRTLRVVGDDGKPVPGAMVAMQLDDIPVGMGGDWLGFGAPFEVLRQLGRTDADGVLRARLPDQRGPMFASAEGRAGAWAGWLAGRRIEADRMVDGDAAADEVRFVLPEAAPLRGRIVDGGVAVGDLGVQLACSCRLPSGPGVWYELSRQLQTRTAADGSFALPVPHSAAVMQLGLQARPGRPAPLLAMFDAVSKTPLVIDLQALPVLRLQVLTADGGPALAARALLLPSRTDVDLGTVTGLPLDRAGRLQLRLQPGRWMLFASDRDGYVLRHLDVPADTGADLQLRLQPLARMRGHVRDAAGGAVVGVGFHLMASAGRGTGPADAESQWLRHFGFAIDRGLLHGVHSGADGGFELRFVPVAAMQYSGALDPGKGPFQLVEDDEVELTVTR